ncbi:MAG: hypothetical protein R2749_13425 [Acidimicrobiales bacterium]
MPTWTKTLAGLALGGALVLSACGGSGADGAGDVAGSAGTSTGAESSVGGAAQASPLPAVTVTDIASGAAVPLDSLLPADKPLLVWMWAPS